MFEDQFRKRQIFSVVWVHADHWEPWGQGINGRAARKIEEFARQIARFRFARKMTLFHLAAPNVRLLEAPREGVLSAAGDRLEFLPRSDAECTIARSALGDLMARVPVEFQLQVHHEQFSYTDRDWNPTHAALKQCTTPQLDEERFCFLVKLSLDILRADTGLALPSWAFVHGNWALNASDRDICQIESEVQMLQDMGGWGDFSFPAGSRSHCDPTLLDVPYTIRPIRASRCYDLAAADPRPLAAGANNFDPGRFLIWTSKAKSGLCSLDIMTPFDQKRLRIRETIVNGWLRDCPVIDGTLYIKTHAHSMSDAYFEDGRSVPLCDPDVVSIFGLLELACEKAGVELRACTIDEMLARLHCLDTEAGAVAALQERGALIVSAPGSTTIQALPDDEADRALEGKALEVLSQWLARDPEREARIGSYYAAKIARRQLFTAHDRAIATYCADRFPDGTRFVELGFGLGELPLLFGRRGLAAVGYESERPRFEAAAHAVGALQADLKSVPADAVRFGQFPAVTQAHEDQPGHLRVFVCGHVTNSHMVDKAGIFLEALRDFDHLVMDVSTFGTRRDEVGIDSLRSSIQAQGFAQVARVFVDGLADIRHFRRRQTADAVWQVPPIAAPAIKPFERACDGVLGIVGSSYCGSTLLNMMLDSHPDIGGAGEVQNVFRNSGNTCAFCGEQCPVWTKERRAAATRDNLFDVSASAYRKRLICDSSKNWTHFLDVGSALSRTPSTLMLLVKHPVRHVSSFLEKARRFENMAAMNDIDAVLKTLLDGYDRAMARLRVDNIVRYEDLTVQPRKVLTDIVTPLGVPYAAEMERWVEKVHHHIGGNAGPRFQSARHIKPVGDFLERKYQETGLFVDDTFRQILSAEDIDRVVRHPATITMCRQFGYELQI